MREHGGFSTLYINARIFDVKSDFHKTVGEKMAVRNEKGEPYRETYGPEHFTVNCPSDTLWRDYLLDTAEFCVKAYGCDGIYLDQLASAEPFACYCAEHSHENIGEFNNGYVYVLRELLRRLRKHNPNAYIMTENCGDIYGSYTWGNLTWNGAEYDEYYNVFKYTFPEFVQVNMVNPRGWETEDRDQRLWFYRDMHRAVTLGSVLWMGITTRRTANIISMAGRWRGSAGNCSRCSRKRAFWTTPGWRLCRTSAMRPAGSLRTGAEWWWRPMTPARPAC